MQDFYDNPSELVLKYWNSYKFFIISATVMALAAIFSYTRYNDYQEQLSLAAAEHYYTYVDAQSRDDVATQQRSLHVMKEQSPGKAFTAIACLKEIGALLQDQQWDQAEEALISLETSTEIDIFKTIACYKRAELYYSQKRFDESLKILATLELQNFYLKQHLLARIYAANGEKQRALEIFEELLQTPNIDVAVQALWSAQYQALALEEELA